MLIIHTHTHHTLHHHWSGTACSPCVHYTLEIGIRWFPNHTAVGTIPASGFTYDNHTKHAGGTVKNLVEILIGYLQTRSQECYCNTAQPGTTIVRFTSNLGRKRDDPLTWRFRTKNNKSSQSIQCSVWKRKCLTNKSVQYVVPCSITKPESEINHVIFNTCHENVQRNTLLCQHTRIFTYSCSCH